MSKRPGAIVFDAVGTLIFPDPPVPVVYRQHGRRFGSGLREDEVARRFRQAFARQEELDAVPGCAATSEARERHRWQAIVGEVFDDVTDRDGIFESLWNHFSDWRAWQVFEDVPTTCQQLQRRGTLLAVASNFDRRLTGILRHLPPLDGCQCFISSMLGCRKPSPSFFARIAEELNLPPAEILMVGDHPANDFLAARSAGWQAVLVDRSASTSSGDVICRLTDLLERLAI